ncbi:MAG: type II toxin-antitoxin system mRNA interferase toxin, RelE/StbE family [Saprospiraceae bacterium]|nr:type II toxin-antitoxin system mRNA interferase toxin, RelE/StbE family [Saprospiraceae bacterium]
MAEVVLTESFKKKAKSFLKSHPTLIGKYKKTLLLLQSNPSHPSLRLHKIKGNLSDLHSVSLNMKYRILLDFIVQEDQVILIDIGDHDGLF